MVTKKYKNLKVAILFLLPFMTVYLLFMVYPIFKGFYTSLCDVKLDFTQVFIGVDNYKTILNDKYFWQSMTNTFIYVAINTPVLVITGLIFAMLLNAKLRGNVIFRTAFFLPYVLSISVVAYIWKFILQPYSGLINTILHRMGMPEEIMWLQNEKLVWGSIVAMTVWSGVGFNMIMFFAGLQEIDENLYEAAEIDGAGTFAKFIHITLPGLKNITLMITMMQTIASMKLFSHTFLLTKGGPGTKTRSIVHYIYVKAFTENKLGVSTAMSVILLIVMLSFAVVQYRVGSGHEDVERGTK